MKYKVVEKKKPGTGDFKFYGQVVLNEPVGLRAITDSIQERCTVTRPDILAVLDALEDAIIKNIAKGHSVRLGTLGSFRPSISSEGSALEADWSVKMIKKVRGVFSPSAHMRNMLGKENITFTEI